ncbi:hypothetical protein M8756_15020 [Lutimaribacter sp. EGI FJ00015]|uniref:Uncharacterized protein n=1 Tax=Lutimaribacter degradans TaxID=2945989 RepID=A0ACC6A055_9RHOB|nr:hypothetical protein [Lutimaribacter sp. EGI FJ00013]MCM2563450.1 hypothetical protein [Lutimaribacter sp. EGI FJ00013]MCO0614630.1 hypothetical protein [Lutimaribacter sp. EGI FJ00015]MCO0637301.1 hypothetical protein [Lutimaribacter sp. EGI FJ00014]
MTRTRRAQKTPIARIAFGRVGRVVRNGTGVCALVLGLVPAAGRAEIPLQQLDFLSACTGDADIDRAERDLQALGWSTVNDPNDALIEDIAWINAAVYFAGDTGGETLERVMELQRKAAANLVRRKDLPRSRHRFLTRDGETLVLFWRGYDPVNDILECRAALDPATMSGIRAARPDTGTLPAYSPMPPISVDGARVEITLLNTPALTAHDAPDAIIHTYATQRKTDQ